MLKSLLYPVLYTLLFFVPAISVQGQSDTAGTNAYEKWSLKDLLSVKIVSVSKESELLFDAPLSASVLTREEIQHSGCSSVMEAMRLVPGVIVRQQTNGNYDIHLRGMDNVPPNTSFDVAGTTTLVMIDSRPIYSYLRGGTFWETLPVDLNDIERIEIVRGPAAALYGPNAVNGVINIITRRVKKEGIYAVVNSQQGSNSTFINNAAVGFKKGKWSVIASGNDQERKRSQTSYFEFNRNEYMDNPAYLLNFRGDTVKNVRERYPNPALAMSKKAGNLFINYAPSEKTNFTFSAGTQNSTVQKIAAENEITPLSTAFSKSSYLDLRGSVHGFNTSFSYNSGTQVVDYDPGNKYDFHTLDASLEYDYSKNNFSIRPGFAYKAARYDDTKYSNTAIRQGIFNSSGLITTASASLRGEYKMLGNKLRLVAGAAASKFNYPDDTYFSYELAVTYKLNKKHLVRAVLSHAPRSSNILDTYADQALVLYPSGYNQMTEIALLGNKKLKLLTARMIEVGYRGQITEKLSIDGEAFSIHSKNYNIPVQSAPIIEFEGAVTIYETPIIATNLPLTLSQRGLTVSLDYTVARLQVKPFITFQHSVMKNYAPYHNTADAVIPGAASNNIYTSMGRRQTVKSTPAVYGGGYINFCPGKKWNINSTVYYYSSQTYSHLSSLLFNDGVRGTDDINAKLIIDASISYKAAKGLQLFCTGKNLLNDRSREFFRADAVPLTVLAGIHFEL